MQELDSFGRYKQRYKAWLNGTDDGEGYSQLVCGYRDKLDSLVYNEQLKMLRPLPRRLLSSDLSVDLRKERLSRGCLWNNDRRLQFVVIGVSIRNGYETALFYLNVLQL